MVLSIALRGLFLAMAAVESGHDSSAVGDYGRAIGSYQIHSNYWKCAGLAGQWGDCRNPAYAERVILAYWQKYCPEALANGNLEVLARIHNGGPAGCQKQQTMRYWRKIRSQFSQTAGKQHGVVPGCRLADGTCAAAAGAPAVAGQSGPPGRERSPPLHPGTRAAAAGTY